MSKYIHVFMLNYSQHGSYVMISTVKKTVKWSFHLTRLVRNKNQHIILIAPSKFDQFYCIIV